MAESLDRTASSNNRKNKFPNADHNLKKRQPQKHETGDFVIYVSTKSNIKALRDKCEKLIRNNTDEIIIYCLGAAIQRGIVLALQICENNPSYKLSTNTLTAELIDDLEPAADEADYEIQRRNNSALRIRLLKVDPLTTDNKTDA